MVADTSRLKQVVPVMHGNEEEHRRLIANALNGALDGRINAVGTLTLTAGATSSILNDLRIGINTVVLLMPTTANAATALASIFIVPTKESATINHANTADIDKTFNYAVFGG